MSNTLKSERIEQEYYSPYKFYGLTEKNKINNN